MYVIYKHTFLLNIYMHVFVFIYTYTHILCKKKIQKYVCKKNILNVINLDWLFDSTLL